MEFAAWKHLQNRLQALEATLVRRENVVRLLVGRFVLMLTMILAFWFSTRNQL